MYSFLKATLIRAARTICQTAVAAIGTAYVLADVNWYMVFSASVLAGILSILTSIITGLPEAELQEHIYMHADEPADAEIKDDDE